MVYLSAAMGDELPLGSLRVAIDSVDDRLLELLNERAKLAEQVAVHKQEHGGDFYVPARERAIIDRLQQENSGPFPDEAIRPVFQEVISACLSLEKGVRVAYLGPEATFTHQAVKRHFGTSALTVPCGSIGAVFGEVERGEAEYGVVPVENSSEGVVNHTLDRFVESPLRICAEIVVDVEHCLLARPGVKMGEVERVYSHPQALAQCRGWLAENLPRAMLVESPSTAEAARAAKGDARAAAISAELASRLYGLNVLRRKLQDVSDNVTRFLVMGAGEQTPPAAEPTEYKTTILINLSDRPGHLFDILQPLSKAGINLTKIESRPSRLKKWDYIFFLDLDGHCQTPEVARVLETLASGSELFKVLGSYRKADQL
jgi:chorismate mutase/prephenate dehydratase